VDERIRTYESSFRRAGLPNLIEHYTATEDVFTRALPFLSVVFLLQVFNALNLAYTWWANVLAFAGGLAILLIALGILNVVRDRPFASRPRKVGAPELSAFVALPAILPLVFGGQWRSSLVTLTVQLVLLAFVYLVVGFGIFSILRWAGDRFVSQLRASLTLLVRALPLLLFFALITFFTNEYWQMFALAVAPTYLAAIILFVVLAALFLLVRIPTGVRELERDSGLADMPLRRAQRINVGLVIFVSQVLQVVFVVAAIWVFFVVFGSMLVNEAILRDWIGRAGDEVFRMAFFGTEIRVTVELLRAATGTAAFSGLYYTVAIAVDSTYRDEFVTQITEQMRETFAKYAEYLTLLREGRMELERSPESAFPAGLRRQ
jgi:hypothetical protein